MSEKDNTAKSFTEKYAAKNSWITWLAFAAVAIAAVATFVTQSSGGAH